MRTKSKIRKLEFLGYPDFETREFRFSQIVIFRRSNILLIDPF